MITSLCDSTWSRLSLGNLPGFCQRCILLWSVDNILSCNSGYTFSQWKWNFHKNQSCGLRPVQFQYWRTDKSLSGLSLSTTRLSTSYQTPDKNTHQTLPVSTVINHSICRYLSLDTAWQNHRYPLHSRVGWKLYGYYTTTNMGNCHLTEETAFPYRGNNKCPQTCFNVYLMKLS